MEKREPTGRLSETAKPSLALLQAYGNEIILFVCKLLRGWQLKQQPADLRMKQLTTEILQPLIKSWGALSQQRQLSRKSTALPITSNIL